MNLQLLEYARIEITRALMDNSGKTKGQLQAFCEHPSADKDRNPCKPVHVVDLGDCRGGVQCVKAENSALYVLERRSRRRPLPPINDYEFAATPWRRAVNMLPEHEQAWLKYCYGFDLTFRYQTLICEVIWNGHQRYLPKGLLKKTQKRLVSLVWLAAQDVAAANNAEINITKNRNGPLGTVYRRFWSGHFDDIGQAEARARSTERTEVNTRNKSYSEGMRHET